MRLTMLSHNFCSRHGLPAPFSVGHQSRMLAPRRSVHLQSRQVAPHRQIKPAAFMSLFSWTRASPAKKARQELVRELASPQPSRQRVDELVDQLLESEEPFNEKLIGGGPWQVVYSRGPLLWRQWTSPGKLVGARNNKASQEFQPQGRRVINQGQVVGESVFVTAEGTYEPQDAGPRLPQLIQANITSGTLHFFGRQVPLPIKGSGLVYLAYVDDCLRVFRSPTGAVTVQIREDRLDSLMPQQ